MARDTKTTGARINVAIEGLPQLLRAFDGIKTGVKNRVLRKAIRAALRPVLSSAKATVPVEASASPRGWLRRSLIVRIATLKRDGVIGLVGPRTKYITTVKFRPTKLKLGNRTVKLQRKPRKHWATKIAHLSEFGTKAHTVRPTSGPFRGRDIKLPGARPQRWLERAWNSSRGQAAAILQTEIAAGIEAESAKYAIKGKSIHL